MEIPLVRMVAYASMWIAPEGPVVGGFPSFRVGGYLHGNVTVDCVQLLPAVVPTGIFRVRFDRHEEGYTAHRSLPSYSFRVAAGRTSAARSRFSDLGGGRTVE